MCTMKAKRFNVVFKTLPEKGTASTYILFISITWFFLRPHQISKELILRKLSKMWLLFALIAVFTLTGFLICFIQTEVIHAKRVPCVFQGYEAVNNQLSKFQSGHPLRLQSKNKFRFRDITKPAAVWNPGSFVSDNSKSNSTLCNKGVMLLILVTSSPDHVRKRQVVRQSWAIKRGIYAETWQHIFLIGRTNNATLDKQVLSESQKYGDILLGDYMDSYRNLSLKVLSGFTWAEPTCRPSFVLKTDDDCYVNTILLPKFLYEYHKNERSLYVGNVFLDAEQRLVIRQKESQWSVSEKDYAPDVYPPYASGLGYLVSGDVLTEIVAMGPYVSPFAVEDAYVGVVAEKIRVNPKKSYRFTLHSVHWTICNFLYLFVVHGVEGEEQHKIHDKALRAADDCKSQRFIKEWG